LLLLPLTPEFLRVAVARKWLEGTCKSKLENTREGGESASALRRDASPVHLQEADDEQRRVDHEKKTAKRLRKLQSSRGHAAAGGVGCNTAAHMQPISAQSERVCWSL
jgi:hypothetical protein